MLNTKTKSVLFWNRNWNNSHDKLSDFLSIPVQYKIRYLLKFEFELESLNSEKYSESDSGIDSSPGIITPLPQGRHRLGRRRALHGRRPEHPHAVLPRGRRGAKFETGGKVDGKVPF